MITRISLIAVLLSSVAFCREALSWQKGDSSLALLNGERVVWQFNYGKELARPYFHPVCLMDGTGLTALSPPDHPWHYALWFAWKELSHINYWEPAGKNKTAGRTEVVTARTVPGPDGSARIELTLSYHPENGPAVLRETRTIVVRAPAKDGSYRIDWHGVFVAGEEPVLLKGGTAGGGYAGMSVRIAQTTHEWRLIDCEGREDTPGGPTARNTHGQRARWMDFSVTDKRSVRTGGIAILEHPSSFRHPAQWHNIIDETKSFGYFSPAPLWSEPYTLQAGKTLTVYYRLLIHPGRGDRQAIDREWKKFSQTKERNQ
ncbi:MAG: PmoA family protein [Acidobacteria bacterium]|nr:PmoA family protein [Acidobacteriota bacterium]